MFKPRRLTVAGLGLVAVFGFGVAGCNTPSDGTSPAAQAASSAPQQAPREALTAAAQKLNEDTVKVTTTMTGATGMEISGVMDPAAKKASMVIKLNLGGQDMDVDAVLIGTDVYLKMSGLPSLPDKWMHLDAAQVGEGSPLAMLTSDDPAGADKMIEAIVDIEEDGERAYKGTLDLTKSPTPDAKALAALGDKAKAVPFTATVDDEGRLTSFVLDMSAVNASLGKMETTYSDFGTAVTVEKPAAGETVEAPAELVKAFAG